MLLCKEFGILYTVLTMVKKQNKTGKRSGLQAVTLCISTAMVLVLLGLVVFTTLAGHNLSSHVKENLVVTLMLEQDMSSSEGQHMCLSVKRLPAHMSWK